MPTKARELAAGKDSGLLKIATICGVTTLLIFPSLLESFFCIGLRYETAEIIHHSYCKTGTTVCYSCKWFNSSGGH